MKISIIMASFLGEYPGCATNRDKKFIRAVNSVLKQTHEDKELIIVSDGCAKTNQIYEENWKTNPIVKLFPSSKQTLYSGGVRGIGVRMATDADLITYLDNDDVLGKEHLKIIHDNFDTEKYAWIYYDDLMVLNKEFTKFYTRVVEPRYSSIGTSSITHINYFKNEKYKGKTNIPDWSNGKCNGYGHDFMYVFQMAANGGPFMKIKPVSQYIVCHYQNGDF